MRTFEQINQELELKKYCDSPHGTLYFAFCSSECLYMMVRHFDSELPVSMVDAFASLTRACQEWVTSHPTLYGLVRVIQPIEVGRDFIARELLTYYTSIREYDIVYEDELAPEPPDELVIMRTAFHNACMTTAPDSPYAIIAAVLARSLLESTGKTVFDEGEGRFIVVEIKPTLDDLERWSRVGID